MGLGIDRSRILDKGMADGTWYVFRIARPMFPNASGNRPEPRLSRLKRLFRAGPSMLLRPSGRSKLPLISRLESALSCRRSLIPNSREERDRATEGFARSVLSASSNSAAAVGARWALPGNGGLFHSPSPGKLLDCCPASTSTPLQQTPSLR